MKTCKDCNISYEDDKKFCKKCGTPLTQEYNIDPRELAKKAVFEDRLKADPLNLDILHEYAQFLFNNLLFKNALATLLKILAINENDEFAKKLLFGSYLKLKMYKEAQELGEQLLGKSTTDILLLEGLAEIELQKGNKIKANEYYETILKLQPANPKAMYHKAIGMLDNNEIENATNILKQKYAEGDRDRIVSIYAGVDQCLSGNHKETVEILETCLSGDEIALNDVHNQRGFLYLTYSLCKTQHPIDKVSEWFSLLDYDLIKRFQQPIDEVILAKAIDEIIKIYFEGLKEISAEAIQRAIKICINKSIICSTEVTHNYFAETWHKIANIQISLGLMTDAQTSLKKAIELNPANTDYEQKLNEITTRKKRKKRKANIITASLVALAIMIVISIVLYDLNKENKAWERAKQQNTYGFYENYLRDYPNGKFTSEAINGKEEWVWSEALTKHTLPAYEMYFKLYPHGKYVIEFEVEDTDQNAKGKLRYVGQIKDGKKEGIGIGIYETNNKHTSGTYSGQWANDEENGNGTEIWVGGDKYEGGWKNGLPHGTCKYYRKSYDRWYFGTLKDGKGRLYDENNNSVSF